MKSWPATRSKSSRAISSDNDVVEGNTVWGNHDCGIQFNGDASQGGDGIMKSALIEDNIIVVNAFTTDDGDSDLSLSQWQAATGQDLHSKVATPAQLFVDPATNDYLESPTSPSIDAGTSLDAPAVDILEPFSLARPVQLVVYGQPPSGLEDSLGRFIDGGSNDVVIIRNGAAIIEARPLPLFFWETGLDPHVA
jgi:hypothetical protein